MKKTVPIFLGVIVASLMLTSFLSAVNSEIIIANNAVLVVTSQPVIASDTTISALEPEKYDSMIDSFHADNNTVIPEYDQNNDLTDSSETGLEQVMPDIPDTKEPEGNTRAALVNESDAGISNEALKPDDSDKTIETEAPQQQDSPASLYTAVEINNDNVIESESPATADNNTVFTVQAGSYADRVNAGKKYKSLIRNMNDADLDNLRIEKVGEYYTVRLGSFDHYVTAMKFLNAMNSRLSSAIVLNANIKNERIVKLHNNAMLAGK
jgi:hypothetical protein